MKRKVALTRREPQRKLPTKTFRRRPSDEDLPTKTFRRRPSDEDLATKTFRRRPSDEDLPTKTFRRRPSDEDDKEKRRSTNTKIHRRRRAADKSHYGDELKQFKKKNDANKYTLGMYAIMYCSKRFSDKDRKGVGRAKCNRSMGGRLLF